MNVYLRDTIYSLYFSLPTYQLELLDAYGMKFNIANQADGRG